MWNNWNSLKPIRDLRPGIYSRSIFVFLCAGSLVNALSAQSLDLTVSNVGLSFGDSEEIIGMRFNFRDRRLRNVKGINTTLWSPHDDVQSIVTGLALGLPITGAKEIRGVGIGILGAGAEESAYGLMGGLLGAGAGKDMYGIGFGLLGAGAGGDAVGLMVGGIGAGAGGNLTGIGLGLVGAGAGNDATGIMVGGIGAGAGNDATGIMVGGIGVGAGRDATGVMAGIIAGGAGRDLTGVSAFGIAVGAGRKMSGVHAAILAAGAPTIKGFVAALAVGGEDITGLIIAPAYFRVEKDGVFKGLSVSAFNRIKGEQRGLTIGILNWTQHLNGLQIGLLNFAGNKDRLKWLPIVNYHRD